MVPKVVMVVLIVYNTGVWGIGFEVRKKTKGSMEGFCGKLVGISGAKGGDDSGIVAIIGVSFPSWGIGSSPMKS